MTDVSAEPTPEVVPEPEVAPEPAPVGNPPVVVPPAAVVVDEKTEVRDEAKRLLKRAEDEVGPIGDRFLGIADRYLALARDLEAKL